MQNATKRICWKNSLHGSTGVLATGFNRLYPGRGQMDQGYAVVLIMLVCLFVGLFFMFKNKPSGFIPSPKMKAVCM